VVLDWPPTACSCQQLQSFDPPDSVLDLSSLLHTKEIRPMLFTKFIASTTVFILGRLELKPGEIIVPLMSRLHGVGHDCTSFSR
jgi:hypothetical protein